MTGPALAAEFQVTISAGEHARQQAPVRVPLELTEAEAALPVLLLDEAGKQVPAQLTAPALLDEAATADAERRRYFLNFLVSDLPAGESRTYTAKVAPLEIPDSGKSEPEAALSTGFHWKANDDSTTDLSYGAAEGGDARSVLRYMYAPLDESSPAAREQTFKVFHHLFDPSGQRIVTKGPGGLYTHHRGLFFGFNRISYGDGKQADVWHAKGKAHQSDAGTVSEEAGEVLGRHQVRVHWHGQAGEPFALENRELTAFALPDATLIEFAARVNTLGGPIKLDGDPQHAGFHFRADNEVADKTKDQTYYLRPDGKGGPGETRNWPNQPEHVNLPWNAMSFVLGDQRYTALYLDRPENPKEARFSERDYGRFGSYFEYEVTEDSPLEVNYRVLLVPGELTAEAAAAHHANFVDPPQVTVQRK